MYSEVYEYIVKDYDDDELYPMSLIDFYGMRYTKDGRSLELTDELFYANEDS
jgi:hypothetical protein